MYAGHATLAAIAPITTPLLQSYRLYRNPLHGPNNLISC